jgi:hypothetical protein
MIFGRVWAVDNTDSGILEITGLTNIQNNSFIYNLSAGSVCHFVLKPLSCFQLINLKKYYKCL